MANSLHIDLTNKMVIDSEGKKFFCESGFGCSDNTSGGKVYGYWINKDMSKERGVIRGELIKRLA